MPEHIPPSLRAFLFVIGSVHKFVIKSGRVATVVSKAIEGAAKLVGAELFLAFVVACTLHVAHAYFGLPVPDPWPLVEWVLSLLPGTSISPGG